ncbi:MAG TPA: LacI family DNA-binding transcriptional regulator, partial [Trueperaceae bacterium]|nr:LacI family DNA-binding transcriptional regulator [Trueperaceae bacterium]
MSAPRTAASRGARPTIHGVAEAAGVSIGTVSRVLNDRAGVRPATRTRVNAAIALLGYDPDRAARELSNRRPVTVGLSTAFGHRRLIPFFVLFLEHLMDQLATSGLRLKDVPTGSDGLPAQDADAYILLGA